MMATGRGVVALFCCCVFVHAVGATDRPIVGIITEPSPSSIRSLGSEFICASYVKFVESSGARVAPIRYTDDEASLRSAVKNLNGLLFPGGGADLEGVYMNALTVLFDEALATNDAGEYFPIWGTCLGFEELLVLASGEDSSILDCDFDSENISMPVYFTSLAPSSRLWSPAPSDIYSIYENESVTLNNHVCGMTPAHFNSKEALTSFYDVLSTNYDRLGVEFISSIEGKNYPFYGVQWHPEKPMFEWNPDEAMNHGTDSIAANSYPIQFISNEIRKSTHSFPTQEEEESALIYNYSPVYTADRIPDYEQCYMFQ